ncbi:MAG: 16S rRNA (cytidine(1402)-2'-O)-methyltransferase [Anaerolineales bacterium]|nr:MAG: 16S rRNA (cytidine(1402)-2'-O)-methyltransferase [Anaerolineales bacterium]
MGTLFIVATPIGNLEDITLRAIRTLGEVKLIAAEDTRHTRQLLSHYDIHTPLTSYHEHSKPHKREKILEALENGDVALVSDAGTPGLNDPGYPLISEAIAAGHRIIPVPGPSAPIAALTASGLPTDTFIFFGYVPRKQSERRQLFETLRGETRSAIFFEVPNRILGALEDLQEALGSERPVVLGRELTKMHEEFMRGSIGEVLSQVREVKARGEYTLILGGAQKVERWTEDEVSLAFAREMEGGASRTEAARAVAALSGWSRKQIYRIGLEDS